MLDVSWKTNCIKLVEVTGDINDRIGIRCLPPSWRSDTVDCVAVIANYYDFCDYTDYHGAAFE